MMMNTKERKGAGMLLLRSRPIARGEGHTAGRDLLRQLYECHTDMPMPRIVTSSWGKPCFETGTVHFSISHTKDHVFCALSDRPIGIDAEELDRLVSPALADKILSPGEKAQYAVSVDKNRALLTFWVLKEAMAKFTGRGLQGYPNHTAFSLDDPRVSEKDGCLIAVIQEEDYAV